MIYTVYHKIGCPYCENTKKLIINNKLKYRLYDVDEFGGIENVVTMLKKNGYKIGNHKTVPIVFGDGEFIGGNNEFEKFINKKKR